MREELTDEQIKQAVWLHKALEWDYAKIARHFQADQFVVALGLSQKTQEADTRKSE